MDKMKPRFIDVTANPIMIVGERPGKQRKKSKVDYVFHGNRTGDFIEKAISGHTNLILTNGINLYSKADITNDRLYQHKGQKELMKLINDYNPKKIICLGNFAELQIYKIYGAAKLPFELIKLAHPSYVLRFNIEVAEYAKKLKKALS
jgi:uracil-DNA glycosylase